MKKIQACLLIMAGLLTLSVQARPLRVEEVPEPLKVWVDWALMDNQDYSCPYLYNDYEQKRCVWPSRLTLRLEQAAGEFTLESRVFAESWVALPGDLKQWPLDVQVNEKAYPVLQRNEAPYVQLPAGTYTIRGKFLWDFIPENLKIPEDSGLIELTVKGQAIEFPIVKQGHIWLKGRDAKERVEDTLDFQIFRYIEDEVPLRMLTRLSLQVAGKQRELKLAQPMLQKFVPMSLVSPLPARIDSDGGLLLQLRPGHWQIDLESRHIEAVDRLALPKLAQPWPQQEIWVFAAHPELRLVEIEKVRAIDAQLTNLPDEWKSLPAYHLEAGDQLQLKLIRRGNPDPEPDQLDLARTLWLDFDGNGYSVNDRITGAMNRSWRLNALPETQLGKASLNGSNQLITRLTDSKHHGIEVRHGSLDLSADSRLSAPIGRINAVGWLHSFRHAQAVLNLPPGWVLVAAVGVDHVPKSWVARWTMLDFFLVLILSFAIGRMWNWVWATFALFTFALIWHEADAPRWIWLHILAAQALLRVLPSGRLQRIVKFYRNLVWLILLVILTPFVIDQVRIGLYPQLEKPQHAVAQSRDDLLAPPASAPAVGAALRGLKQKAMESSVGAILESDSAQDLSPRKSIEMERIDPDAKVQTGPGLPEWKWNSIELTWNGPVDSTQQIRFWYLSPGLSRLFHFLSALSVAAMALLTFGIFNGKLGLGGPWRWSFCLLLAGMPFGQIQAAFPDQEMLDELKSRLLKAPECEPTCAEIPQMDLEIRESLMTISLRVDVQDNVAFPLPGHAEQWIAQKVSIDQTNVDAIYRDPAGVLWVHLSAGPHRLLLEGVTPPLSKFSLPLPLNPHRVVVQAESWLVEGLNENRSPDAQLQFTRQRSAKSRPNPFEIESGILPPFVRVERTLRLGLDWHVDTRIIRLTPAGAAIVLEIPLLNGESVTTAAIRVKDAKALVNMSADQQELQWHSVLAQKSPIVLKAAQTTEWSELWSADISPIWHMEAQGISVIHHQDPQRQWLPEWRPWPGESVRLSIERPKAVPGKTLTIDSSMLEVKAGERIRETLLKFALRSSQGGQHTITLPKDATLQAVLIDQIAQSVRQQNRRLTLPIKPGKQEISVTWSEAIGISTLSKTPEVNLGTASVNASLRVILGRDRWTLWTFGPALGPAVLFWGVLAVIAVVSFGLGKIPITPLRYGQWLLLLIGLSQIPIESALLVIGTLFALGYRSIHPPQSRRLFNAAQIGIAVLTIVAVILLCQAIGQGLLGLPEMQITGNQSSAYQLNWVQDRSPAQLPHATVLSIPLEFYRGLMLAWALWLAWVMTKHWLKWGWNCFSAAGIWKKAEPKKLQSEGTIEDRQ